MSQRTLRSPGLALAVAAVALTTGACQEYGFAPLAGYLGKDFYAVDLNNSGDTGQGGRAPQTWGAIADSQPNWISTEASSKPWIQSQVWGQT